VERATDGDVAAYEELVRRHQEVAFRVAWLVLRDPDEAKDAVQEAFVKAYAALPRFRRGAPFRPWLCRIAANEARNRGRSSRRRDALALRVAAAPRDEATSPEVVTTSREEARSLVRALEALRDEDRVVVAYRYLLELSEAETAEVLGIPVGTVKSRLSRALVRLRTHLIEEAIA
jgi:RNA polymerase sigma-70 factor (ECF subfamily)